MSVANGLHVPWDVTYQFSDDEFDAFVEVVYAVDADEAFVEATNRHPNMFILDVSPGG